MTMVELMQWITGALAFLAPAVGWIFYLASRNKHLGFQKKLEPRTKGVKR